MQISQEVAEESVVSLLTGRKKSENLKN